MPASIMSKAFFLNSVVESAALFFIIIVTLLKLPQRLICGILAVIQRQINDWEIKRVQAKYESEPLLEVTDNFLAIVVEMNPFVRRM